MIKNYFKIAWRNLWKNKLISFINIFGLGLAMPFALISLMQVQSAFEYDNFHPGSENIYRVVTDVKSKNGNLNSFASSPVSLAEKLELRIPFVEKATVTKRGNGWELTDGIKTIKVNTLYVEPDFFNLFAFPLKKGNIPILPNSLILSSEMAKIFLGDKDPVGQTLSHVEFGDFIITGILQPYKSNTHFKSDVMVSMATYKNHTETDLNDILSGFTYIALHEASGKEKLDVALTKESQHMQELNPNHNSSYSFRSQPFSSISPDFEGLEDNPYAKSLSDLSVNLLLAFAILLLAGFNYTNLTLARSLNRAKEVGIRKVSGASRSQLFIQFICEAVLVALLGLAVGFYVLKLIEQFITVNWITWEVDNEIILWAVFLAFTVITGILAGIIPAKILSAFSSSKVLKGDINPTSFGKISFRKSLVVVQFVVTACFIFLIVNMYSQFKFQATDNENYNRKGIYNIAFKENYRLIKNRIEAHRDVESIGLTSSLFGGSSLSGSIKKEKLDQNISSSYYAVNAEFIGNMELKFLAGENLPNETKDAASQFVVVNQQTLFALNLGTPREAVGKTILLNDQQQVIIRGVVKDFNYYLYQFKTQPLVMQYDPSKFNILSVKTKENINDALFESEMAALYKEYFPEEEMTFSNYEKELYDRYFQGEEMKFMLMVCVTIFIIAIMGLLGIVTYTTEKRNKEIGIRKVLGASVKTIVKELSNSFLKLILISTAISLPLGYVISFFFINNFEFNNGVAVGLMLLLLLIILGFALLTIGIQAARAAMANPVSILRTE